MATKLYLPFMTLPTYYTKLLMANYNSNLDFFDQLIRHIYETPELLGLIKNFILTPHEPPAKKISMEDQLKSLGWLGIRDRLAMLFLDRARQGRFGRATESSREALDEILEFEKRTRDISVDGYTRSFLLGFYLKIQQIRLQDFSLGEENIFGILPRGFVQMMLENKSRSIRVDWLILLCLHLYSSRGKEAFRDVIQKGHSFEQILTSIRESHQNAGPELILNLLRYGSSIGDVDFFSAPLVGKVQKNTNTAGDAVNNGV